MCGYGRGWHRGWWCHSPVSTPKCHTEKDLKAELNALKEEKAELEKRIEEIEKQIKEKGE